MLRAHLPLPRSTILDTRVSNLLTLLVSAALFNTISLRADQVETQSGDRYLGKIIAVTANTVTIQNDVLGTVTDRKSTRLNSSHGYISYAVFCLKKKKKEYIKE